MRQTSAIVFTQETLVVANSLSCCDIDTQLIILVTLEKTYSLRNKFSLN